MKMAGPESTSDGLGSKATQTTVRSHRSPRRYTERPTKIRQTETKEVTDPEMRAARYIEKGRAVKKNFHIIARHFLVSGQNHVRAVAILEKSEIPFLGASSTDLWRVNGLPSRNEVREKFSQPYCGLLSGTVYSGSALICNANC
jgi:hypothetical protein